MNTRTKAVIEILKRPAEFPVELVIRAMAEVRKITAGEFDLSIAGFEGALTGADNGI